ncbi:MAG: substrate-binding domain-containing protein, partial [Anaerolineae bacterium]
MFKSKKWWLLLTSLVVLGLALAACRPATVEPTKKVETPTAPPPTATPVKKIRIGLFVPVSGNTYEEARLRGAQEAAAKLNAEVVNFAGEYDALKQINQIQDAIASKNFDALLIHPIDSNAVVPVVEDALKAGLVVVGADSPIGPNP